MRNLRNRSLSQLVRKYLLLTKICFRGWDGRISLHFVSLLRSLTKENTFGAFFRFVRYAEPAESFAKAKVIREFNPLRAKIKTTARVVLILAPLYAEIRTFFEENG